MQCIYHFSITNYQTLLVLSLLLFFCCQDYESSAMCSVKSEPEADEKLSHMRPVVVPETLNLARYVTLP